MTKDEAERHWAVLQEAASTLREQAHEAQRVVRRKMGDVFRRTGPGPTEEEMAESDRMTAAADRAQNEANSLIRKFFYTKV